MMEMIFIPIIGSIASIANIILLFFAGYSKKEYNIEAMGAWFASFCFAFALIFA